MSVLLLIGSLVLFLVVALSAFMDDINANEIGFLAAGLACYVASLLFPKVTH